ncbi:lipopolysaccharide assembly LapA domain-containing protein [Nocardia sp. NPDC052566]|uniref:lipopolysaccharide assembly LapA domain-containing protein n=1 Tax=Nocardia sp. NPDC052566 TaxID=3364330 RepID=UPI0037C8F464
MTTDAVSTPGVEPSAAQQVEKRALRTRAGFLWGALIFAAVLGIVVLIFILQNLEQSEVSLFAWDFSLPIGILVLLSAIAGALVMALVGGFRILQLRRAAKKV